MIKLANPIVTAAISSRVFDSAFVESFRSILSEEGKLSVSATVIPILDKVKLPGFSVGFDDVFEIHQRYPEVEAKISGLLKNIQFNMPSTLILMGLLEKAVEIMVQAREDVKLAAQETASKLFEEVSLKTAEYAETMELKLKLEREKLLSIVESRKQEAESLLADMQTLSDRMNLLKEEQKLSQEMLEANKTVEGWVK